MIKECPACQQKIKGAKPLDIFRNNLKERHPFFSLPCPHCGARLRNTRWPWRMTWMGILLMGVDGVQITTLDMYLQPFAHKHIKVIAPVTIAIFGLAMVLLLGGVIAQKYELQPASNGVCFSRGEKLAMMVFGCLLLAQTIALVFYSAGFGYQ